MSTDRKKKNLNHKKKWLFLIDPIETLNPSTDTTYAIMAETYRRGIQTCCSTIQDLYFNNGEIYSSSSIIDFTNNRYDLSRKKETRLNSFDLIFMRKEPPYDYKFHYATQMLSLTNTHVLNSPGALRDYNEKLIILNFPEIIPETIVTSNQKKILKFIKLNGGYAILKDLDSYQGKNVEKISIHDSDLEQIINEKTHNQSLAVMVQEYIPNVSKGDKRILILGGKAIGAVNRIPAEGSYLANFGQGGAGQRTSITKKDRRIINSLSKFLISNKIYFAGIDVIDGFLTEINITCPTGLQQINRLENTKLEEQVVDYLQSF